MTDNTLKTALQTAIVDVARATPGRWGYWLDAVLADPSGAGRYNDCAPVCHVSPGQWANAPAIVSAVRLVREHGEAMLARVPDEIDDHMREQLDQADTLAIAAGIDINSIEHGHTLGFIVQMHRRQRRMRDAEAGR